MDNLDEIYNLEFMKQVGKEEYKSSEIMCKSIIDEFKPRSLIDFGSGPANHINICKNLSPSCNIVGVDGSIHSKSFINKGIQFHIFDFTKPFLIGKFDVVLCFEVIEHIFEEFEDIVINNILNHTNKYLIMSAAIPNQPGHHHVNCKPLQHWIDKIELRGLKYCDNLTNRWKAEWKSKGVKFYFSDNLMIFEGSDK